MMSCSWLHQAAQYQASPEGSTCWQSLCIQIKPARCCLHSAFKQIKSVNSIARNLTLPLSSLCKHSSADGLVSKSSDAFAAAAPWLLLLQSQNPPLLLLLQADVFPTEIKLLEGFIEALQSLDPDIMVGFEVQQSSVGYLADRGNQLEMPLLKLISRMPEVSYLGP